MKRYITLLLAACMMISLAACSSSNEDNESSVDNGTLSQIETTEAETEQATSQPDTNTTYNVGEFTVFVPEGWKAVPVTDQNDPSIILTNDIQLVNTALQESADEWDSTEGQSFYVTYLSKEEFEKAPEARASYEKDFAVTDMEDMQTGDLTWKGFSVSPIGAPVYMLWAESGNGGFYASISTAYDLSLDDEAVQTMLGSLKVNG